MLAVSGRNVDLRRGGGRTPEAAQGRRRRRSGCFIVGIGALSSLFSHGYSFFLNLESARGMLGSSYMEQFSTPTNAYAVWRNEPISTFSGTELSF